MLRLDGPLENCNLRIRLMSGCFQTCPDSLIKSKIKGENKHCKTIFVFGVRMSAAVVIFARLQGG